MPNEAERPNRAPKNEVLEALEGIRSKYSGIKTTDVQYFAPVYYPIAEMEMRLEEQTFEDFDTVQMTVLRLVEMGICDYKVIAKTLGLSPNYVFKIFRLLSGYGHIANDKLTPLGEQSLKEEKKIVTMETMQKFQVDALNGTLLRADQVVTESALNDKSETVKIIGHLSYMDGISVDTIRKQLSGIDGEQFLNQKSGVLHTNVTAVKEVRFVQIQYAKCYMLKLRNIDQPVIFGKRYDRSKKDIKDRFSWQPFCINSAALRDKLGLGKDIIVGTATARDYTQQLYEMLVERSKRVELKEEIPKAVKRMYPFLEEGLSIDISQHRVMVTDKAIGPYRSSLIGFLLGAANGNAYLITNEHLYGITISVSLKDARMNKIAMLLKDKVEKMGKQEVSRLLRDQFRDYDGEKPLPAAMLEYLSKM